MRCNRGVIEIFFAKSKELHKKKNRIVLARKRLNNAVWRRKRDLNPRAGYPTYSLSRGHKNTGNIPFFAKKGVIEV